MSPPAHPDHVRDQLASALAKLDPTDYPLPSPARQARITQQVWDLVGPAVERVFRLDTAIAHATAPGTQNVQPGDDYLQALQDVLSDISGLGSVHFESPADFLLMVQSVITQRGFNRLDTVKNPTEEGVTGDGR